MRLVIADTSPINYLLLIGHIDVSPALFAKVILPSTVRDELSDPKAPAPVRNWIASTSKSRLCQIRAHSFPAHRSIRKHWQCRIMAVGPLSGIASLQVSNGFSPVLLILGLWRGEHLNPGFKLCAAAFVFNAAACSFGSSMIVTDISPTSLLPALLIWPLVAFVIGLGLICRCYVIFLFTSPTAVFVSPHGDRCF